MGTNEGVFVGDRVKPFSVGRGDTVGVGVGFCDSARVGFAEDEIAVGSEVGSSEGPGVGNFDGEGVVGERLGDCVGPLDGPEVGKSVGLLDGTGVGDFVGFLDGTRVGDFVVGVAVVGGMVGDCVGWEVGLPIFLSGSTITLKDDVESSTKLNVSSGFSSTKIAPLKSPGRKVSGSLKGKATLFIKPMRSAFSLTDKSRRRSLTAMSLIDIS